MYRLAVFPVRIPPLRDRQDDRMLLAEAFLQRLNEQERTAKRLSAESVAALWNHRWPGNVRELKNAIERAFIMADEVLELASAIMTAHNGATDEDAALERGIHIPLGSRLDQAERSLIEATLEYFEGNKRQTAETLGCSLKTLYNKLNTYSRQSSVPA
jgi:DNA-binding NtrC family response regulator